MQPQCCICGAHFFLFIPFFRTLFAPCHNWNFLHLPFVQFKNISISRLIKLAVIYTVLLVNL